MRWAIILLLFIPACVCQAEELSVLLGVKQQSRTGERSLAGQIEYRDPLSDSAAWSISYLNEGHFSNHHRDGALAQLWLGSFPGRTGMSFSAGIGPYYYFDTNGDGGSGYSNDHGFGGVASVVAAWKTRGRMLYLLRANWVETSRSIDTFSFMAGVGYDLSDQPGTGDHQYGTPAERNEISIFIGRAIVNSFSSEHATAASVEYRRRLLPNLDGTASWLYEGHNSELSRNGITAELWGVKDFLEQRLSLALGAGGYRAIDVDVPGSDHERVYSLIASVSAAWRLTEQWDARLLMHRIITSYNRDSDVILGGVGYRF